MWPNLDKQKEPITQNIRNRRERSSRFKVMFYVIGSEKSKSGSAFYSSRQQNQRRGGAVRHFRCTDTVSDESDYLSICLNTSIFSCMQRSTRYTNIIQMQAISVNVANAKYVRTMLFYSYNLLKQNTHCKINSPLFIIQNFIYRNHL